MLLSPIPPKVWYGGCMYEIVEARSYLLQDAPPPREQRWERVGDPAAFERMLEVVLGHAVSPETHAAIDKYGLRLFRHVSEAQSIAKLFALSEEDAEKVLTIVLTMRPLLSEMRSALPLMRSIEDVAHAYHYLAESPTETLLVLGVDLRYQLQFEGRVASGPIEHMRILPRDIMAPILARKLPAFLLVHNHPSGDPTPSESDIATTQQLVQAAEIVGVQLLDHVIIARDGARSALFLDAPLDAPGLVR